MESQIGPDESGGSTGSSALYFSFIAESLGQTSGVPNNPGHIFFGVASGKAIPTDIMAIHDRIEHTAVVIRELYLQAKPEKFARVFRELLSAAQLLAGPTPIPEVVDSAVARIRETVVMQEGKHIRTRYLNGLGGRIFCVLLLFVGLAIGSTTTCASMIVPEEVLKVVPYYVAMLCAATVAIWLSFASRKPRLTFDDLLEPEGDMMGPWHRIAYVILFTGVLAIFCAADVVGVSIGSFSTSLIASHLTSAIIFGFVCGFSEKLLATTVAPHVSHVLMVLARRRACRGRPRS